MKALDRKLSDLILDQHICKNCYRRGFRGLLSSYLDHAQWQAVRHIGDNGVLGICIAFVCFLVAKSKTPSRIEIVGGTASERMNETS